VGIERHWKEPLGKECYLWYCYGNWVKGKIFNQLPPKHLTYYHSNMKLQSIPSCCYIQVSTVEVVVNHTSMLLLRSHTRRWSPGLANAVSWQPCFQSCIDRDVISEGVQRAMAALCGTVTTCINFIVTVAIATIYCNGVCHWLSLPTLYRYCGEQEMAAGRSHWALAVQTGYPVRWVRVGVVSGLMTSLSYQGKQKFLLKSLFTLSSVPCSLSPHGHCYRALLNPRLVTRTLLEV